MRVTIKTVSLHYIDHMQDMQGLEYKAPKGGNKFVKRDFSKHTNLLVLMNFLLCR